MKLVLLILVLALPAVAQSVPDAHQSAPSFALLTMADIGVTVADVEATQHCISNHTCREGNPLLPSSRAGAYAVGLGVAGVETGLGWWMRRHGKQRWWVPQTVNIAAHGIGIGFTLNR